MQYEVLFLVGQDRESNVPEIEKEVDALIVEAGGELIDDRWENKRKLAYPVRHSMRGTYIAKRFVFKESTDDKESFETASPIEMINNKLLLSENILRFIIVRAEEMLPLKEFALRKEEEKAGAKKSFGKPEVLSVLRQPAVRMKRDFQKIEKPADQTNAVITDSIQPIQQKTADVVISKETVSTPKTETTEKPSAKTPEPAKKKTTRTTKKSSSKKEDAKNATTEEDIDKKLEEILNM